MKNRILFSYEDKYIFYPNDLATQDYNITDNNYEPLSDNSLLFLTIPPTETNVMRLNFAERTSTFTNISIYYQNENGELSELNKIVLLPGRKTINIEFTKNTYSQLYVKIDQPFSLQDITLELKHRNFLQKSPAWIISVFFAMFIASILTALCTFINTKTSEKLENPKFQERDTIVVQLSRQKSKTFIMN